ncbi:MAG: ABC transporter permease, partial [Oscillospiraceae bacterium]
MKIFDLLRLCLDNLRRRKGRTALTVVGVMVGTCSIVVMVSLGVGINQTQMEMMASWGDLTQIQIMNHNNNANSEMPALDDAKIAEIQNIPKVLAATPVYQSQVLNSQIFAGKKEKYSTSGW